MVETETKSEILEVEDMAAREGMEDTAASAFSLVRTEDRGSPPFLPTSSAGRARDQIIKCRTVKKPKKHRYYGFTLCWGIHYLHLEKANVMESSFIRRQGSFIHRSFLNGLLNIKQACCLYMKLSCSVAI